MSNLRSYAWLEQEPAPRILKEALKLFGVIETAGDADNPAILSWAKELGLQNYHRDETPWCGLFLAICAKRAGYAPPRTPLWALSWQTWGRPTKQAMLGDVVVFERKVINPKTRKPELHGHVGLYVGEDVRAFHVYGGNQDDQVGIKRIARARLLAARRCKWPVGQPPNVRPIDLRAQGNLSSSEE